MYPMVSGFTNTQGYFALKYLQSMRRRASLLRSPDNILVYCSVRDWTRFLRHRIRTYPDSPVNTLSDSLRIYSFSLWRVDLIFSGFAVEFAGYVWTVAACGKKKLRIRKYLNRCERGLSRTVSSSAHWKLLSYRLRRQ